GRRGEHLEADIDRGLARGRDGDPDVPRGDLARVERGHLLARHRDQAQVLALDDRLVRRGARGAAGQRAGERDRRHGGGAGSATHGDASAAGPRQLLVAVSCQTASVLPPCSRSSPAVTTKHSWVGSPATPSAPTGRATVSPAIAGSSASVAPSPSSVPVVVTGRVASASIA